MAEKEGLKECPLGQHQPSEIKVQKEDTNLKVLLEEHKRLSKQDVHDYIWNSPPRFCFNNYRSVDIRPHNRGTLNDLTNAPNAFLDGKFIVCRTLTPSIKIHSLLMVVEIPDPWTKNQGALLSLGNFICPLDEKTQNCRPTLSPGTILLVKNPLFFKTLTDTYFRIKCDNPADVVVLGMKKFRHLFPKLEWPSRQLQSEENELVIRSWRFWTKPTIDWKGIGELRLQKHNYIGALEAYQYALGFNPRDLKTLTLRSSLYLKLKVYQKALKDSRAILELDNKNKKGIYNKALSLIGLGRYKCAVQFLQRQIEKIKTSVHSEHQAELLKLVSKANSWSRQEEFGEYDLVEMFECSATSTHDCADYMGNVRQEDIPGKGKGIVAAADIRCGELIVTAKAFAIAYPDDQIFKPVRLHNSESVELRTNTHMKLVSAIAHRLLVDPELGKILYGLHDGTERCVSEKNRDIKDYNFVDMKRISLICDLNCFCGERDTNKIGNDNCPEGLWPSASYFNHSCSDANSICMISGDIIIIRACKNIKMNEEVTLNYVPYCTPYLKRRADLAKYGFVCQCTLCQLDAKDTNEIHIRRQERMTEIRNIQPGTYAQKSHIQKLIMELKQLRPEHHKLNISMYNPLIKLAKCCVEGQDYDLAVKIYHFLHKLSFGTVMTEVSMLSCFNGLICCLKNEETEDAAKWIIALKANFILRYGTDSKDLLKFILPDLSRIMTLYEIDY